MLQAITKNFYGHDEIPALQQRPPLRIIPALSVYSPKHEPRHILIVPVKARTLRYIGCKLYDE